VAFPQEFARKISGHRFIRYVAVTATSVLAGQLLLAIGYDVLRWPATIANIVGAVILTGPAFVLNRTWVWRCDGKASVRRQTAPFWILAFIGLGASTTAVALTQHVAVKMSLSHHAQTLAILLGSLFGYGVIWIARFVILDRLVFGAAASSDSSTEFGDLR
jgi:putative flippase GtrA